MSHPKCRDTDYIDFLIATPRAACCCEAARCQPPAPDPPAHDAFTRLLHRLEPDPETLWREARPLVDKADGLLVLDDSTLDKLYAKKIELVDRHWSGKHKPVVRGINLITLVWTDGDRIMPLRLPALRQGQGRPDQERPLPRDARRGQAPRLPAPAPSPSTAGTPAWRTSRRSAACGWTFLTQLKVNRQVDLDRRGYRAVGELAIAAGGDGRPSGGVRADPGLQGRLPRRGH